MGTSDDDDVVLPSSPTIITGDIQHEDVPLPPEEPDPLPASPRNTLVTVLNGTAGNKLFFQDITIEGFTVPWPIQSKWMMLATSLAEEELSSMTPLENLEFEEEILYLQSLKRKDKMISAASSLREQLNKLEH